MQRQYHRRHPSDCQGSRPRNWVYGRQNQQPLPLCRRFHVYPPKKGRSVHNPTPVEVVEQHNDPLPPHHREELHSETVSPRSSTWRLHAHPVHARRFLVPSGTNWPSGTQSQGFSGGLAQDQCGLRKLKIAFLAHSNVSSLTHIVEY